MAEFGNPAERYGLWSWLIHLDIVGSYVYIIYIYMCVCVCDIWCIRRPRQTQGGARQGMRQASLAAPAAKAAAVAVAAAAAH